MKSLGPSRYALAIGAAAALLAGCGGVQPPIVGEGGVPPATSSAPEATSQNTPVAQDRSGQRLFVTEYTRNTVLVYNASAKNPSPERHITIGVAQPTGACVDGNGTLYVVNARGLDLRISSR